MKNPDVYMDSIYIETLNNIKGITDDEYRALQDQFKGLFDDGEKEKVAKAA